MAAEGGTGSKVVICTDGLSNVGLGGFDCYSYCGGINGNQADDKEATEFYESVGKIAQDKGVQVDIITIQGDECNIQTISKMSELTGGFIERVDPSSLTKNFGGILSIPTIATKV